MTSIDLSPGQFPVNAQVLEAFYGEQWSQVYHYVYRKVGNRQDAEDVTSSVFLKAVRGLRQEWDAQSMRSWLLRVAHTTIIDYWRARARAPSTSLETLQEAGWEGPAAGDLFAGDGGPEERVQRVLQALPPRERAVLTYRFLHGLSARETAARLSLSEGNVGTLQYRALKHAAALASCPSQDVVGEKRSGSDGRTSALQRRRTSEGVEL